jgi:hypothetical protein
MGTKIIGKFKYEAERINEDIWDPGIKRVVIAEAGCRYIWNLLPLTSRNSFAYNTRCEQSYFHSFRIPILNPMDRSIQKKYHL